MNFRPDFPLLRSYLDRMAYIFWKKTLYMNPGPCWISRGGGPGGDSPPVKPTDDGDDDDVPTILPIW